MKHPIKRPDLTPLGLAVAAGVLAAAGQAPLSLWHVSLIGFGMLFWLARRAADQRQTAWVGWGGGVGYFIAALSWIVEPFLVDIARHGWMAPFAIALLGSGLALLWAAAFWLAARLFPGAKALALILLWTGFEALRSVLFTGFPWALVGHIWIDTPVRMVSAVAGPHGLTLLTFLIAGLPFAIRREWIGGAASLAIAVAVFGYGALALNTPVTSSGKKVRLVQPNAPQHEKWDPDMIPIFFNRLRQMTAEPGEVDLIVWPESALAWRLDRAQEPLRYMADAAAGTPLVFGVNDFVNGTYRNALAVMGPAGEIERPYHKHHLVPFGEYVPFANVLSSIGIRRMTAVEGGGFAPGPGPELIDVPGIGPVLPLICYELIFPRHLSTDTRANLILQVTNDAWFGNLTGPYQHLAQARLRAVEQGLPVLRAANTGVSAVIDPLGRVLRAVPLNETGYLDEAIPAPLPQTAYARFGDKPVLLLLIVALGLLALRERRNKH